MSLWVMGIRVPAGLFLVGWDHYTRMTLWPTKTLESIDRCCYDFDELNGARALKCSVALDSTLEEDPG